MNYQEKINKIIAQLEELWNLLPNTSQEEQTARQQLRAQLESLQQGEIKEIEALGILGDTHLQEKSEWLTAKAQLEKDKREAEQALVNEKKRLSEELVKKIDGLTTNGNLDESKVTELKSLLTDLKNQKSANLKLSEADRKELVKEIQKEQPINYWSIGGAVLAGIACLITASALIFKKKEN